ncbi:hypothetical protein [Adhaeretor mobilis]|uniref:Uncharacterized protein n=1 Tax=Adhaeretor mobilis TaxID=1930276 RepID=A0A517MV45_9BACT|nr:hypothetical protein [Adhaeretor mobilis]QDS98746.1 hypothetical protein HG15A2_20290 [Adhaeretor mobilis]
MRVTHVLDNLLPKLTADWTTSASKRRTESADVGPPDFNLALLKMHAVVVTEAI